MNLIGPMEKIVPVEGHAIMEIDRVPQFDHESEHLYVKKGKLVTKKAES